MGYLESTSLGKRESVDEEAAKNDTESKACSQKKDVSHVNFSMIFFSLTQLNLYFCLASHQALIISQSATKRAHPRRSLPVYLKYLYNTWDLSESIIIPLLCLCGLFTIHVYQKIQLCLKMWFSISFDNYNVIHWSSHICQKSSLLSFDSFLVEFSE